MTAATTEGEDGGINIIAAAAVDGNDRFLSRQQHRRRRQMDF